MDNRNNDPFFIEKSSRNNTNRDNASSALKFRKQRNDAEQPSSPVQKTKKPFDKKKWRHQKYSIEFKMKKWEESRKKRMLHKYRKDFRNKDQGFDVQKIYAEHDEDIGGDDNQDSTLDRKNESDDVINSKPQDKSQCNVETNERNVNFGCRDDNTKQSRTDIPKKKFRKTKKGQPIMKDRLENLFQKIKHSILDENE